MPWSTISKADDKSKSARSAWWPESIISVRSEQTLIRAVSVEWPFQCVYSGHISSLIFLSLFTPAPDYVQCQCSDNRVILDTAIVDVLVHVHVLTTLTTALNNNLNHLLPHVFSYFKTSVALHLYEQTPACNKCSKILSSCVLKAEIELKMPLKLCYSNHAVKHKALLLLYEFLARHDDGY